MKVVFTKFLSRIMMLCVFVGICNFDIVKAETIAEKSIIWVIGDSTVSEFSDNYYYPRYGYGTQLGEYINSDMYEIEDWNCQEDV